MTNATLAKDSKISQSSLNFFADLIEHPGARLDLQGQLLEPYYTNRSAKSSKDKNLVGIITEMVSGVDQRSALQFKNSFVYGLEMEMWRKQNVKSVTVFVDPNLPNLVWFSTKTKSFLFDMTYTDIDLCDLDLQKASGFKQYFILRYFEEELPLVFKLEVDKQKYFKLFNNYIKYNRLRQYPPFFSRIMKMYTAEEVKSSISRKKTANGILNITKDIFGVDREESQVVLMMVYLQSRKEKIRQNSELRTNQIRDYFRILHCSQNLMKIFQKYSQSRLLSKLDYLQKPMSRRQFINFLQNQQKISRENAENIASNINETLNFYEFCTFLQNQKINHAAQAIKIEQDLPLTDYFCYSSHNTYLSGNQLTSDSKIQRYLQDLERGLKCLEIDIHNDGDTPIINHALGDRSLCSPIDFQQTIKEIAKFCNSNPKHYPIILSIENHAKEENRYKVANILLKYMIKQIFFINQAYQFEDPIKFMTLKELRGKIIVKTDSKLADVVSFKKKPIVELNKNALKLHSPEPIFPSSSFQQSYNKFQQTMTALIKRRQDFDISMPNTLFLPISQMTKVTGLFKSENGIQNNQSKGCQCTSITNQKAAKRKDDKIADYTRRSFLRIYPHGTEISSSNYDPVPHLKIGAQIIALNTQTKDQYAWMMMSYFNAGRYDSLENIGYIQKPDHLRSSKSKAPFKKIIKIQIISELKQIQIQFFGSERDMKTNSKGKKVNSFEAIDHDEAFLMFTINENLKECIPIRFIRQGYRVLVAKNSLFKDSGIRVIIHISINQEAF